MSISFIIRSLSIYYLHIVEGTLHCNSSTYKAGLSLKNISSNTPEKELLLEKKL